MKRGSENQGDLGNRIHGNADLRSALLDEILEGIIVWDKNGKCSEVNRTACTLLGYKREELLGLYFSDLVVKNDSGVGMPNADDSAYAKPGPARAEMQRKDGTLLPVEIGQRLLADGSVAAVFTSVGSQPAAEERVRNVSRLYATLSGINHAIVRTKDRAALFEAVCEVAVSKGGFAMAVVGLLGENAENIRVAAWRTSNGKQPSDTIFDLTRPPLDKSLLAESIRTGRVIVNNNAESFICLESPAMREAIQPISAAACIPIRATGTVIGMLFLGKSDSRFVDSEERMLLDEIREDISYAIDAFESETEKETAEDALRESEETIRRVMEQMNDAVIVISYDGKLRFVSQAVERIIGYRADEVIGRHFDSFLVEDDKVKASQEFEEVLLSGEGRRGIEIRLKKKDGSIAYCEIDGTVYRSSQIVGVIGVVRDVSERKKAEEEFRTLESKRKELEHELIQAQRLESLGTLAGGIAHDFNNLLGIIMGYSTMLQRRKPEDTKLLKGLESIHTAAERGAALVRHLLTIARKTETVFSPVNINDTMEEITGFLKETLPKSITISKNLQENLPTVLADSAQLHQVFMNISINSRDAMPMGGTLSVATSVVDGDTLAGRFPAAVMGPYVLVRIGDTGVGMDEETKRKMFDPFFTTKMPGAGTGLGLSLVYSIVEVHRGIIDVESEEGKGTVFNLYFPVNRLEEAEPVPASDETKEVAGGVETVLVIEDEEMLLDIMRNFLVQKGYSVMGAHDGEEGISIYSEHSDGIDLVVLDLGLPKLSGEQVIEQMRAVNPAVKIAIASGFIDSERQTSLMNAGISVFIEKPYSMNQVLVSVRKALDADKE